LELLGYHLRTPMASPGGTVELVALWRATTDRALPPHYSADAEPELVFFTHALDKDGVIVGQEDRLDAPNWDWKTGDVIAQIHRFTLRSDVPLGSITLEVGVYQQADLTRLPVMMDGIVVGDKILLSEVEVMDR
jgi:hypothetical protein